MVEVRLFLYPFGNIGAVWRRVWRLKKKKYLFEDNLASDLSANSALSDKKRQEYTPTWNKSFLYLFHTNFMVIHFRILNSTSVRVAIAAVKSHENKMPSIVSYLFATCCPSINSHPFGLITLVVFLLAKTTHIFIEDNPEFCRWGSLLERIIQTFAEDDLELLILLGRF